MIQIVKLVSKKENKNKTKQNKNKNKRTKQIKLFL